MTEPETTERSPGFYWIQHEPYEGRAQLPIIAELSDMGNWYICGIDGREDPARFKVLTGPLPPPESQPQTTPAIDGLISEAKEIIKMAEDLRDRGLLADAMAFGFAAAQRLRAARVLQDLHECPMN